MNDKHTDGNGAGGLLAQVLAVETTSITRRCQSCGEANALGAHRAYHGAATVLRCPSCEDVAVQIAEDGDRVTFEWRGTFTIAR